MFRIRKLSILAALIALPVSSQPTANVHESIPTNGVLSQMHRLDFAASYRTEPVVCDHLPTSSEAIRGTMNFSVIPATNTALRAFRVSDVNWLLTLPEGGSPSNDEVLITGTGTYILTNSVGPFPVLGHRLTLTLRIGDERNVQFDSGLIPNSSTNALIDIEVHEVTSAPPCERRHIRVVSSIVPCNDTFGYVLGNAAAFFVQPSPLAPLVTIPIGGPFAVVALPIEPGTPVAPGQSEWAIVKARWFGGGSSAANTPFVWLDGAGIYQHVTGTFSGIPIERLRAEFSVYSSFSTNAIRRPRFDSGLINGSPGGGSNSLPFFHILIEDVDPPEYPHFGIQVVGGPLP